MKIKGLIIFSLILFFTIFAADFVFAEDKKSPGGLIPKLQKTPNDPELFNNFVYPMWGPLCQRYTYTVSYRDQEGRPPEYMRIIFNGKPVDMEPAFDKSTAGEESYQNGVRYQYKFVPDKIASNFYYFEASNGLGKARASIIDSPDNGPVLFEGDFLHNEIAVIESYTGQKILSYPTKEEWVGGVALSDDGKYLAAKTSKHIYLFDLDNPQEPKWVYQHDTGSEIGGDLKGGVAISGDASKIIASIANSILLFSSSSNQPVWRYDMAGNAYNVAISKDGNYLAAATGGSETDINTNLLILWHEKSQKPLWQYHASGNFHDVSLSADGKYIAASTGCPDRRFYVFSPDSNTPLVRSEALTRDSPVHRAKISADGSLAAVGSESDAGAVFLFPTDSTEPIWKFPTQNGSSVRALNFTPDGLYIGASTLGGQAYIFTNRSNQPLATWTFNAALGGIDIADDGSFIVVGGTDNKIHILSKDKQVNFEIPFAEYLEEIDISANGKYVAAGTGGSVYFFETISEDAKTLPCTTIIEPRSIEQTSSSSEISAKSLPPKFPGLLTGFAFIGSVLTLGVYYATVRFNLLRKSPEKLVKLNKKILMVISAVAILFLILTVGNTFFNTSQDSRPGEAVDKGNSQNFNQENGVCGNDICQPGLGESKDNCPQDCSGGN